MTTFAFVLQVPVHVRLRKSIFSLIRRLPMVSKKIAEETDKVKTDKEKMKSVSGAIQIIRDTFFAYFRHSPM